MPGEIATDRRLWEISGKDGLHFLQGLVSNDVRPLETADGIVWAALLSPQGKYLADFFVVRTGGRLFIDISDRLADPTLKRLTMYRLRADVQIAPLDLSVVRGLGEAPAGALPDPRHPALGWRGYGMDGAPPKWTGTRSAWPISFRRAGSSWSPTTATCSNRASSGCTAWISARAAMWVRK